MKIDLVKINGYGKLENKEISFGDHINIIKGNNESGKSTLMSFITSSLYGIAKTKNGKDISDFDKYRPWTATDFSGKIKYRLDDENSYEIYRDFRKKTPEIYHDDKEVTSKFNIDKTKGSDFFVEQTGITEEMFLNTFGSEQESVKLNKNSQNSIIQKLSNVTTTGSENISYKKTMDKINKRQLEEIGTERSSGRPINIVNNKIANLQEEIKEIEEYKERKYEIEEEKNNLSIDLEESQNELGLLRKVKALKEKNSIKKEKVNILDNEIDGYSEMQEERRKQIEELKEQKSVKRNFFKYIFLALAIICTVVSLILHKLYGLAISGIFLILFIVFVFLDIKRKRKNRKDNKKYIEKRERFQQDISRLEEIKNLKIEEVSKIAEEIEKEEAEESQKIINEFKNRIEESKIKSILSTKLEEIVDKISEKEAELTNYKVSEKQIEVTNDDIIKNLENLVNLEEKLDSLYEEKEELENKNEIYNIVKNLIEESYEEMKENITPDFVIEIKNIISKATGGKYNNCIIDDEGIKIETKNGNYVDISRLSVGTIDLIYLALRISAAKSISNENIPIILDEAFAYYDKDRMENIIKYLNEYCENQVIILTCSKREIDILEENKMEYNLIEL